MDLGHLRTPWQDGRLCPLNNAVCYGTYQTPASMSLLYTSHLQVCARTQCPHFKKSDTAICFIYHYSICHSEPTKNSSTCNTILDKLHFTLQWKCLSCFIVPVSRMKRKHWMTQEFGRWWWWSWNEISAVNQGCCVAVFVQWNLNATRVGEGRNCAHWELAASQYSKECLSPIHDSELSCHSSPGNSEFIIPILQVDILRI